MATTIYSSQPGAHYAAYPQPPPSPPIDEASKCSLPSISNLLVMADAGSPTTEQFSSSQQGMAITNNKAQESTGRLTLGTAQSSKADTRPNSSHYTNSRAAMPPTPPMSTDASFESHGSPSARSVSQVSVASAPNYYYETTPPLEADLQRHHTPGASVPRMHVPAPAYSQSAYNPSSYMSQPPALPPTYYAPVQTAPPPSQISGLYYQRPLPQAFPPLHVTMPLAPASGPNPWQHHHYISPSSAASFPQSQDRYICQTCNKAFSRPSSLRIHSHSHTGEKPFKCPHAGCGKAFSVRSNMKRHERGCHNFDGSNRTLH
ncbi:hypothetical protein BX600DRAFT_437499 [Xylariales sp. PMI_506]|nr:hypothetical protein BX600DRAFT_437499 [Xylariales sp. PMI_506]